MKNSLKQKITSLIFTLTFIMIVIFLVIVSLLTKGIIERKSKIELKNYSEQIYSLAETSVDATVNNFLNGVLDVTDKRIASKMLEYKSGNLSREKFIEYVVEVLKEVKVGTSGYGFVLDKDGNYLYHPYEIGKNVKSEAYIAEILQKEWNNFLYVK